MCMSLLWYYRPENLDCGQRAFDTPDEIYVSQHRDHTSVACIEDKWYVMTFKRNMIMESYNNENYPFRSCCQFLDNDILQTSIWSTDYHITPNRFATLSLMVFWSLWNSLEKGGILMILKIIVLLILNMISKIYILTVRPMFP